jgi:hypothetical protein
MVEHGFKFRSIATGMADIVPHRQQSASFLLSSFYNNKPIRQQNIKHLTKQHVVSIHGLLAIVSINKKQKRSFEQPIIIRNIGLSPSRITKKPTRIRIPRTRKNRNRRSHSIKKEKAVHHQDVGDGTRSVVLPPSTLQITPWILALYRII